MENFQSGLMGMPALMDQDGTLGVREGYQRTNGNSKSKGFGTT